jgi:hypothetical protein
VGWRWKSRGEGGRFGILQLGVSKSNETDVSGQADFGSYDWEMLKRRLLVLEVTGSESSFWLTSGLQSGDLPTSCNDVPSRYKSGKLSRFLK